MKKPLKDYLEYMVNNEGSDLYFTTAAPPSMKRHGQLEHLEPEPLAVDEVKELANNIMSEKQQKIFEESREMNLAISEKDVGRFRVNIFQQRNQVAMVIRWIKTEIPRWDDLGVPEIMTHLIMEKQGLILFVGATGSGKSTTMASLINHRNQSSAGHIITIEDPIEYVHRHQQSIVNQREVGIDTEEYGVALKNTLRQAPDVILIGEIRASETMEHAIAFSETGHLCLSTLHANNANQALDRIINFFPKEKRDQILLDLSFNLKAIIAQRLIPSLDSKRVLATEVLINSPLISDLIRRGEIHSIKDLMKKSENIGMQTFDTALFNLYQNKQISVEEALKHADSKNNLKMRISLDQGVQSDNTLQLEADEDDGSFFSRRTDQNDD